MAAKLKVIDEDGVAKIVDDTDYKTKDELIGRPNVEVTKRIVPVFEDKSQREVKFGFLKDVLKLLGK